MSSVIMRATSEEMSLAFWPASLDAARPNNVNSPATLRHEKGGGKRKGGEGRRSLS